MILFKDGHLDTGPEADHWRELLSLLPGYDPLAQAQGCWFDTDIAQLYLDFFPECLKHIEGQNVGKPFVLERWQQSFIGNLHGWRMRDDQGRDVRRFREALLYCARGQGKTPLAAGLTLECLILDRTIDHEGGTQCYSAAGEREQAALLYRHASNMVLQEPELEKRCDLYVSTKSIVLKSDPASFYRAISADAKTKHGYNAHCVVVDELHVQPNRELVDTLVTSTKKNRAQPLIVYITTADWMRESICNEVYDYACRVRDGLTKTGQRFLPAIYEAKESDEWQSDEAVWRKANPNLGVSISLKDFRETIQKAVDVPAQQANVMRLHLNIRTQSDVRAIDAEQWKRCGFGANALEWRERMMEELRGEPCIAGIDLGAMNDISAMVLTFHTRPKPWPVMPFFWITQDSLRRRRKGREPWDAWVSQGWLMTTPGNSTNYDQIREFVTGSCRNDATDDQREYAVANALTRRFYFQAMIADVSFQGLQLSTQFMDDGIAVEEWRNNWLTCATPTKRTLEMIAGGEIAHGNNPVLTWMAGNVSSESDKFGLIRFSREKSSEKIDGIIAMTMCIGCAEASQPVSPPTVEVW